jgi:hypothetical protein
MNPITELKIKLYQRKCKKRKCMEREHERFRMAYGQDVMSFEKFAKDEESRLRKLLGNYIDYLKHDGLKEVDIYGSNIKHMPMPTESGSNATEVGVCNKRPDKNVSAEPIPDADKLRRGSREIYEEDSEASPKSSDSS